MTNSTTEITKRVFVMLLALLVLKGCSKRQRESSNASLLRDETSTERVVADVTLPSVPGFDKWSDRLPAELTKILDKVPSNADSWETEVFSEAAKEQLKRLAKVLRSPDNLNGNHETLFAENFQTASLRPRELADVFDDRSTKVYRGSNEAASPNLSFALAAEPLFVDSRLLEVHFKIVRVEPGIDEFRTTVLFDSVQQTTDRHVQQNAEWRIVWTATEIPKIKKISVSKFEEITATSQFRDVTPSVLGQCESYERQIKRGIDYWRRRLEANYGVDPNGNQGIAIGDANGDGLEDVFVCQQGGLPNRLYAQRSNGQLEDISRAAGVDWMEMCRSALFLDLDNDGDQDLVMAQGWYVMIMANDGKGHFQVVLQERSQANLHSMSAADYDNDGDVDVFLCGRNPAREFGQSEGILGTPIPYHDANNGGPNILLRNEGGLKFNDVTIEAGLDENNRRYSYAASWEDFDNDGDMDLYVANDFGRNNLYRNDLVDGKRVFSDVAATLGVEDISAGMSITWGDFNNDGLSDAYISNMFSSAGNRIAFQRRFRQEKSDQHKQLFQRHARGNTLFESQPIPAQNGFRDVSQALNVTMGRWAWGAKFCDFNCDGWQDLYVANGFITTEDTGDL